MVDIWAFKIGGSSDKLRVYNYEIICDHWNTSVENGHRCIKDEFCEYGHMIPRDIVTIQTGFNIYMILQIL